MLTESVIKLAPDRALFLSANLIMFLKFRIVFRVYYGTCNWNSSFTGLLENIHSAWSKNWNIKISYRDCTQTAFINRSSGKFVEYSNANKKHTRTKDIEEERRRKRERERRRRKGSFCLVFNSAEIKELHANVVSASGVPSRKIRHLKTIWREATHINCRARSFARSHFRGYNHEDAAWRRRLDSMTNYT